MKWYCQIDGQTCGPVTAIKFVTDDLETDWLPLHKPQQFVATLPPPPLPTQTQPLLLPPTRQWEPEVAEPEWTPQWKPISQSNRKQYKKKYKPTPVNPVARFLGVVISGVLGLAIGYAITKQLPAKAPTKVKQTTQQTKRNK